MLQRRGEEYVKRPPSNGYFFLFLLVRAMFAYFACMHEINSEIPLGACLFLRSPRTRRFGRSCDGAGVFMASFLE